MARVTKQTCHQNLLFFGDSRLKARQPANISGFICPTQAARLTIQQAAAQNGRSGLERNTSATLGDPKPTFSGGMGLITTFVA